MTEKSYRIRTNVGEEPSVINVKLNQTYDTLEILSLKLRQEDTYKLYKSNYGVVVGRVIANGGVGIPNAKVSIFIAAESGQTYEDTMKYPFSNLMDKDNSGRRYNLLPNSVDDSCHQNVGSFPNKRLLLDNNDLIETFEKYYKYTTTTNESGDYMIANVPTGAQQIHVDVDLSDIGFLSQRPRDMMYKGYTADLFESPNKFKQDTNLDSLAQIYTQNVGVYVFPFWGDTTEDDNIAITRCDIQIQYKFEPTCVFMGSVIADNEGNIGKDCTATKGIGKMKDLIASQGRIEMIRKTNDGRVEEFQIKGNRLIDENGVWCYQIPMNLDYITTDEFGNMVPTDDPSKGIPTRTSVRFRVTLDDEIGNYGNKKRCSYLIPNNPRVTDDYVDFSETKLVDYEFGTNTREEDYRDLFWNKVYTVKNFIPRFQVKTRHTEKEYSGIKSINHGGNNNRFPYNGLFVKLTFNYMLLCIIMKFIIYMVAFLNNIISVISEPFCRICDLLKTTIKKFGKDWCLKVWKWRICPLKPLAWVFEPIKDLFCAIKINCIRLGADFCDDGQNRLIFLPGCHMCTWDRMRDEHTKTKDYREGWVLNNEPKSLLEMFGLDGGEDNIPLMTCVENSLAQENECTSYNFYNDWINGVLYFPKWYREIRPKKKFLFGLFTRKAKDEWCSANFNTDAVYYQPYSVSPQPTSSECGDNCHKNSSTQPLNKGLIVSKETMLGQTIYYYKAVNFDSNLKSTHSTSGNVLLLYATDIVLLGSLNENDVDGTPQFFKHLPITTYQIPNDILSINTEVITTLNADGTVTVTTDGDVAASGQDWGNSNPELCGGSKDGDSGLFYGIGCSSIDVKAKSVFNLRRICELGVGLDTSKELPSTSMNGTTESVSDYVRLVSDGFVSYDEIYGDEMRAMFATMNGNNLRTEINPNTGYKQYNFKYLYPTNFDGGLATLMKERQRRCNNITYRLNYQLETKSADYINFRMGEKPYYYDEKQKMPRFENSFYFYFGIKSGSTAIEKFNNLFFSPCENTAQITNSYNISFDANGWCNDGYYIDTKNNEEKRDLNVRTGFLRLDLSGISVPYTLEFKDKNSNERIVFNDIKEERIYIGNTTADLIKNGYLTAEEGEQRNKKLDGYNQLKISGNDYKGNLDYDTSIDGIEIPYVNGIPSENLISTIEDELQQDNNKTYNAPPLRNGEWEITISDGGGNIDTYDINFKPDVLTCTVTVNEFNVNTNEIYDANSTSKNSTSTPYSYYEYAKVCNDKTKFQKNENTNLFDRDLGGLIKIHNIFSQQSQLNETDVDIKIESIENIIYDDKIVLNNTGNQTYKTTNSNGEIGYLGFKEDVFYFGVPLPLQRYKITVTQKCDGKLTENTFETTVYIKEPSPYKFFINNIDYNIIKDFKSGWNVSDLNKQNTYNIRNVVGWNNLSKIKPEKVIDVNSFDAQNDDIFNTNNSLVKDYLTHLKLNAPIESGYCPYRWTEDYCYKNDEYDSFIEDLTNFGLTNVQLKDLFNYNIENIKNNNGKSGLYEIGDLSLFNPVYDKNKTNEKYKLYGEDGITQLTVKGDDTTGYYYDVDGEQIPCDKDGYVYIENVYEYPDGVLCDGEGYVYKVDEFGDIIKEDDVYVYDISTITQDIYKLYNDDDFDGIYEYTDGTLCDINGNIYDTSMTIDEKLKSFCDDFVSIAESINAIIEKRKEFVLQMKENFYVYEEGYNQTIRLSSTTTSMPVIYKLAYQSEIEDKETELIGLEHAKYNIMDNGNISSYLPTLTSDSSNKMTFYYDDVKKIYKQPYLVGVKNARNIIIPQGVTTTEFNGNSNVLGQKLFHVHIMDKVFKMKYCVLSGVEKLLIHPAVVSDNNYKNFKWNKNYIPLDGIMLDNTIYNGMLTNAPSNDDGNTVFNLQQIDNKDIFIKTDTSKYTEDSVPTIRKIDGFNDDENRIQGTSYTNSTGFNIPTKEVDIVIEDNKTTLTEYIYSNLSIKLEPNSMNYDDNSKNQIEYTVNGGDGSETVYVIKCNSKCDNYPYYNITYSDTDKQFTVGNKINPDVINNLKTQIDKSISSLDDDGETVINYGIGGSYGTFRGFKTNGKYFFLIETANNCYGISPIYDFTINDVFIRLSYIKDIGYFIDTQQSSYNGYLRKNLYNYTFKNQKLYKLDGEELSQIKTPILSDEGNTYYVYTNCNFNDDCSKLNKLSSDGENKIQIVGKNTYIWIYNESIYEELENIWDKCEGTSWLRKYRQKHYNWIQYTDVSGLSHRRYGLKTQEYKNIYQLPK